jgi:DNA-binding transcriptional LysR family regulator
LAGVELRQLMAFEAVADTLHFGRAAERLGVAQPAVSQLIRRLEEQLGVTLFERTSHRVAITPAGEALLPDARSAIATVRRLGGRASELAAGTPGSLRIATTVATGSRLADLLRRYGETQPAVELDLQVLPTEQKLANLAAGTLDVAFLRSTPAVTPGLAKRVAWRERFVAVLPAGHPAAASGRLDVDALGALALMVIPRSVHPVMHDELLAVCRSIAVDPPVRRTLPTPQETLAMIATGAAWTLFIEGHVPGDVPGVAACELPAQAPLSHVWLLWRTGAPPHVLEFVALATNSAP